MILRIIRTMIPREYLMYTNNGVTISLAQMKPEPNCYP